MLFNTVHNPLGQVRLDTRKEQSLLPKKLRVDIFCHRHPEQLVRWGCIEPDCESMIMCNECNRKDQNHLTEHKNSIVDFDKFLDVLALEIKKVNRFDSELYSSNIKQVIENEHRLGQEFDKKCQNQIKQFIIKIDDQIDKVIHSFSGLKQLVQLFYESMVKTTSQYHQEQSHKFKDNSLYFKAQFQALNPEENSDRYGDGSSIGSRMLMKSPHQSFIFLRNLRKSANMEGQLLSDLNFLSQKILTIANDKQYFIADFVISSVQQSVEDMLLSSKQQVIDHLKDVPNLNNSQATHSNATTSSYTSFSRHQIRLNQAELFDNLKNYSFKAVGQLQTHHSNSVSALVALSDEVLATSSYDRTIKIWKSSGELMKTLYDKNCVSCLVVFKMYSDKNPQADHYTDDDTSRINLSLLEDPQKKISESGLLLISGGFDRELKVWDCNLVPNQEQQEPNNHLSFSRLGKSTLSNILSQPNNLSEFPLRSLSGHVNWITTLCSLEDQKNVASGDDTGEVIIWDVISGILFIRLPFVRNPCMMQFIALTCPFKNFCCSSSTIIRIYSCYYQNSLINEQDPRSRQSRSSNKKDANQLVPQIVTVQLAREVDVGWTINGCISPYNYRDQGLLIVFGGVPRKLKYVQLDKGRQIEIQGDWTSYIGDMILLEKFSYNHIVISYMFRIREKQMEQFYKNFNLILCGDKQLGLYDGYGNRLRFLQTDAPDDLYASNLLCQRNMQLLKVVKKGSERTIKLAVVSQFTTDQFNYQSSRITFFELKTDILNFQ